MAKSGYEGYTIHSTWETPPPLPDVPPNIISRWGFIIIKHDTVVYRQVAFTTDLMACREEMESTLYQFMERDERERDRAMLAEQPGETSDRMKRLIAREEALGLLESRRPAMASEPGKPNLLQSQAGMIARGEAETYARVLAEIDRQVQLLWTLRIPSRRLYITKELHDVMLRAYNDALPDGVKPALVLSQIEGPMGTILTLYPMPQTIAVTGASLIVTYSDVEELHRIVAMKREARDADLPEVADEPSGRQAPAWEFYEGESNGE